MSLRLRWSFLLVLAAGLAACTPVTRHYQIESDQLDCEEANRAVYAAVQDMGMTVSSFRLAKPGSPGRLRASRSDGSRSLAGTVTIECRDDAVHIEADDAGIGGSHDFERGLFLSVTGRAGLIVDRGEIVGRKTAAAAGGDAKQARGSAAEAGAAGSKPEGGGVRVVLEPLKGFATVLDFEADLSAVGVLPIKVTVRNGSRRRYEFDPRDVVLRVAGSRRRAQPLPAAKVASRLVQASRAAGKSAAELGDVETARRIVVEKELRRAGLAAGAGVTGFLYFDTGDYDRARILLVDSATGESEGFLVEF